MVVASLIIFFSLLVPPFFGKADDGSFYKALLSNGLYNLEGYEINGFNPGFGTGGEDTGAHFLPVTIAKSVSGNIMDIRLLAVLYLPMYIAGMCLMLASIKAKNKYIHLAVSILTAVIFCDIGYIGYFNSLYTDALYISAFLLMAGALMYMLSNGKSNIPCLILTALSAFILSCSGSYVLASVLASAVVIRFCIAEKVKIIPSLTAAIILASCVFFCGFNPAYEDHFEEAQNTQISLDTFNKAANNAPFLTQEYIANRSSENYGLKKEPGIWSYLRRFITPSSLIVMSVFFIAVLAVAVKSLKKQPSLADMAIFLTVSSAAFFASPVLTGGLASISRRLVMHQLSLDILIIIAVIWICNTLLERRERLQKTYGVTQ